MRRNMKEVITRAHAIILNSFTVQKNTGKLLSDLYNYLYYLVQLLFNQFLQLGHISKKHTVREGLFL